MANRIKNLTGVLRTIRAGGLAGAVALIIAASGESKGEALTLTYESAPTVDGPWQKVDSAAVQVNANGSATVNTVGTTFFRMRISGEGQEASIPVKTLAEVPATTVKVARGHLEHFKASLESVGEEWEGAELAPFATPVGSGERAGGYYEFKVLGKLKAAASGGFRKFDSDADSRVARGYIVCSAGRNDLPVLEFATEGESVVEKLLQKCGEAVPARVVRYGATFWVAEGVGGELIANHGTEPFKIPPGYAAEMNLAENGEMDTETGRMDMPTASKLQASFYGSYAEFKADYETNEVYQILRKRRAEHAKVFWNAEEGKYPEVLKVQDGETVTFLPGSVISGLFVDDEDVLRPVAEITTPRTGGVRVMGLVPGRVAVKVRVGERLSHYVVEVTAVRAAAGEGGIQPMAASEPYWKTITEAYAGSWSDQMKWYQLRDGDWCELVGCGPTAIAMLVGWWEHKNSVESAFYRSANNFASLRDIDAPKHLDTTSKKATVRDAYFELHDYCDVICDPFSDAGATLPGDLIEGWWTYLHPVAANTGAASLVYGRGLPLVGYSTSWAKDDWGDDWKYSGSRVATGIKNGRPGVIGLGWLWHYAVAYGYFREDKMVRVNGVEYPLGVVARYLKCNEGWNGNSPSWYSAYEVFLGLSANMWQKRAPQQP